MIWFHAPQSLLLRLSRLHTTVFLSPSLTSASSSSSSLLIMKITHTSSLANSVASSSSGRAHAQYSKWGTYFSLCSCHFCCGWNSSGWGWQSLMNPQKLPNFFFYHLWVIFLWQVLVFAVPSTSLSKRSKNAGPKPFCRTSGVALTHINS